MYNTFIYEPQGHIMMQEQIQQAKQWVVESDAVLITAGAGMGVDSGLPDFRGKKGFWNAYPIAKKLDLDFTDMANPKWFNDNPGFAWAFYGHRLNLYRKTMPHEGFKMLLDLVKSKGDDYFVFTSNVDGQFQKAGFDKQKVYEVHGSIHYFQCVENCQRKVWVADVEDIDIDMEKFEALTIPQCHYCSKIARPNILMFDDWYWNQKRSIKQMHKFNVWKKQIKRSKKKLAIIEIGAGTAIPTVRKTGEEIAKINKNAKLIRINPRDYDLDTKLGVGIPDGGLAGLKQVL